MTQVLIVRHGNTFRPGETPRRVGGKTDLPLVESERASRVGQYLAAKFKPDHVFCSPLLRTKQTMEIALETAGLQSTPVTFDNSFIEIDYGPDENKPEDEVIARLGEQALQLWNEKAIVPDGWSLDIQALQQTWLDFFAQQAANTEHQKIVVVTSNGIARFAPCVLNNPDTIQDLKIATGNMSLFEFKETWGCFFWNKKPLDILS